MLLTSFCVAGLVRSLITFDAIHFACFEFICKISLVDSIAFLFNMRFLFPIRLNAQFTAFLKVSVIRRIIFNYWQELYELGVIRIFVMHR